MELCDDRNDLLIDSIQSCFFINLNFELLGIVNSVKTELMDLRREYPKIIWMVEQSDAVTDEKMMTQLNDMLCDYFMELKLMAGYWKRLLDYLQYDPTFINLFVKIYNERYRIEEDLKQSQGICRKHMTEAAVEAREIMIKNAIDNLWK